MNRRSVFTCLLLAVLLTPLFGVAAGPGSGNSQYFLPADVFELEFASDPQISPDGSQIVYARNFMDIMIDRRRSHLWIINADGSHHRALTSGLGSAFSPRWSPDGTRLLYAASENGSTQLYLRWMDTGQTAKLTHLTTSPGNVVWSPDGRLIAFTMFVPEPVKPFVQMPPKPKGAKWSAPFKYIDQLQYRADGRGYLKKGYTHVFVLPAEGGTPRQLTTGPYNHRSTLAWTPDSKALLLSANRHEGWEYDRRNTEIYELSLADGALKQLTDRQGPDTNPALSPDGRRIVYLGFDDRLQGYQVTHLYVMNRDGSDSRMISGSLDRSVRSPHWSRDGKGLYIQYDDRGNTKIAYISLAGETKVLAQDVGGLSLGRPYAAGSFSVSHNGHLAFTHSRPDHPADVAEAGKSGTNSRLITHLNDDLLGHKKLGQVEEIWFPSSFDQRQIQGWIVKPPAFDSAKKYPLLLEIHGGPFANYGDRFSAEIQLYVAAGYVVLYLNPRGSTSYGEEFGNLIHHNYPGKDYDDLMSGVDAVIAKGYIDTDNLFVTGGSGGGVLSSWIVGKTNRFRAAAVAKPVINWYSFVLTADNYSIYYKYWFPGFPWEHAEHYLKRSSISLVGNVKTPTMLLTGEVDHRTPSSEAEQFYQALKLRKVDAALVRIPGASHSIASRPSRLIAKVAYILKWFEIHRHAAN